MQFSIKLSAHNSLHPNPEKHLCDGKIMGMEDKWLLGREIEAWAEFIFEQPVYVAKMKIFHAGVLEYQDYNTKDFDILFNDEKIEIRDNEECVTIHEIHAVVDKVRFNVIEPCLSESKYVRIYEVQFFADDAEVQVCDIHPVPVNCHKKDFSNVMHALPPGPIGEFGVYEGGSTVQLAGFNRTVYAFDTFEGMPLDAPYDQTLDGENPPGKFNPRLGSVIDFLKKYPNVVCVKGVFQKTLPEFDPSVKFAFVYLDCDWYSSYKFVIQWLSGRMLPGAMALVDDWYLSGCNKAIEEMVHEGIVVYNRPWLRWI